MRSRFTIVLLVAACTPSTGSGPVKAGPTQTIRTTVGPTEALDLTRQTALHSVDFAYPRPSIWRALMLAHEEIGIAPLRIDERAGVAVFQYQDRNRKVGGDLMSNYIDCGQGAAGPRAATYRLTVKVSHTVESPSEEMTRLGTTIEATARHPGMSADAVECTTRGVLEKKIVGMIAANAR